MSRRGADSASVEGVELRRGSRVRLRPRAGGDVFDLALDGQTATVEAIEEDDEGRSHVVVTLDADPGRDLGEARFLGHRFFFAVEEVEPLAGEQSAPPARRARVLVAGIGNVFLGDDGFGVEVTRRLAGRALPAGVHVADFGIRGLDLAYALQDGYEAVVFVDAAPRGEAPGTLSVLEAAADGAEPVVDPHAMDPVRVLALARALGTVPERVLVVACEPEVVVRGVHDDDLVAELSGPVRAAVDEAVELVESLVRELTAPPRAGAEEKGGETG